MRNVDRSSATYHSVTVDDFTVVITEFKPKIKKEKKESTPQGRPQATSINSSSSSPTSSTANTPAPLGLTNSLEKQINGSNLTTFESKIHGSTNNNSALTNAANLSLSQDKSRMPLTTETTLKSEDGIEDRQPVLAAALQSPLKYSGSETKPNFLELPKATPNSHSTTEPNASSPLSASRLPPISSSTHYPSTQPRPHPHHHHQPLPNHQKVTASSKSPSNDPHPIPPSRPSPTSPSSIPLNKKPTSSTIGPTTNMKGTSSSSPSGPTSRASTGTSSLGSNSSSLAGSSVVSSAHRNPLTSGNSANGSMTSPKNSNMPRNS